jgi:hypothetical protein
LSIFDPLPAVNRRVIRLQAQTALCKGSIH